LLETLLVDTTKRFKIRHVSYNIGILKLCFVYIRSDASHKYVMQHAFVGAQALFTPSQRSRLRISIPRVTKLLRVNTILRFITRKAGTGLLTRRQAYVLDPDNRPRSTGFQGYMLMLLG
jgi:hypothetical protein